MDYNRFSSLDFIQDEYFQDWILRKDTHNDAFWMGWLLLHPEKAEEVREARAFLTRLAMQEKEPALEQARLSLEASLSTIRSSEGTEKRRSLSIIRMTSPALMKYAAAVILSIATATFLYYQYWSATTVVATGYHEIKMVHLPDGSDVELNAHSSLSFPTHFRNGVIRKVQLQGQAFFHIRHLNQNENDIKPAERFVVRTDDLDIQVLGTSFDVKKRALATEVVLTSGKVRIEMHSKDRPYVLLTPGERFVYAANNPILLHKVDSQVYTSWTQRKIILQETTLNDIIRDVEDFYGTRIILDDRSLGERKMEGTLYLDDLHDLLFVLSSTMNIRIEQTGDSLVFHKR